MKIQTSMIIKIVLFSLLFNAGLSQTSLAAETLPLGGIKYKNVNIDGLKIFYREAGNPKHPTILLLHGFPTSSHMFRDLIPALSE